MSNYSPKRLICVLASTILSSCSPAVQNVNFFQETKPSSKPSSEISGKSVVRKNLKTTKKKKLYVSEDLAAIKASKLAMKKTEVWWADQDNNKWKKASKGLEFYGYIYKTEKGLFGFTTPKAGIHPINLSKGFNGSTGIIGRKQGRYAVKLDYGKDAQVVGWYHSHIKRNSVFSESDEHLINMISLTGYLANKSGPFGKIKVFKMEPSDNYKRGTTRSPFYEMTNDTDKNKMVYAKN